MPAGDALNLDHHHLFFIQIRALTDIIVAPTQDVSKETKRHLILLLCHDARREDD